MRGKYQHLLHNGYAISSLGSLLKLLVNVSVSMSTSAAHFSSFAFHIDVCECVCVCMSVYACGLLIQSKGIMWQLNA